MDRTASGSALQDCHTDGGDFPGGSRGNNHECRSPRPKAAGAAVIDQGTNRPLA